MEITQTHDTKILSAMVDLLVSSAQGVEDYGFTKTHNQIRYEELASALNHQGFSNRAGQPLNRNAFNDHAMKDALLKVRQSDVTHHEDLTKLNGTWMHNRSLKDRN